MILCCECGISIKSNPSNMCVNCMRNKVDITEGISKQVTLFWCKNCGRYQRPPWVVAELESRELLALCLAKIKGLKKQVKLVDANFIWTEPHSKRIKVKVTVQKAVFSSAILQKEFVVEFVVTNQQCPDCARSFTEHTWNTNVQVRQKVQHKRTFFWLEQMFIKHNITEKVMEIKEQPDGLDFFWGAKNQAVVLINFLQSVVPLRYKTAKRLISQDFSSNTQKYKHTYMVEIAPICKDDLVCLPKKVAKIYGGVNPILVCYRVSNAIHFVDPLTLRKVEIISEKYWRNEFTSLMNSRQLVEFVILDVERESPHAHNTAKTSGKHSRMALAEVFCAREADFGVNDTTFNVMTHLGNILKPGDSALGYDLTTANISSRHVDHLRNVDLPDIVLIKKHYKKKNRAKKRAFRLHTLKKTRDQEPSKQELKRMEEDYEAFVQQVEEDPDMWGHINFYKKKNMTMSDIKSEETDDEEEDAPQIPLEALQDLKLDDTGRVVGAPVANPFEAPIVEDTDMS